MKVNIAVNYLARQMRDAEDTSDTTIRCALNELIDVDYDQDRTVKRVRKLIREYRRLA